MKRRLLLTLVLFILFTISVSADNVNTLVKVYPDGTAKITQNLIINSLNTNKGFSFPAISPEMVEIVDSYGKIKFATLEDLFLIQPRKKSATYSLTITYLTNSLTKKDKNTWELNYLVDYPTPIIFSFPESTKLIDFSEKAVVYSEESQLKLGWKLIANSSVKIVYETDFQLPYTNYYKILLYVFSIIIILMTLMFYTKKWYCKIAKRLSKGKKDIIKTLDRQESEVINFLINKGNQSYQSIIQKETGINKATLSRIIKRLENKRLVEVRQTGNTNLIILNEWFIKK
jgi:uncharacterized membrane protein